MRLTFLYREGGWVSIGESLDLLNGLLRIVASKQVSCMEDFSLSFLLSFSFDGCVRVSCHTFSPAA